MRHSSEARQKRWSFAKLLLPPLLPCPPWLVRPPRPHRSVISLYTPKITTRRRLRIRTPRRQRPSSQPRRASRVSSHGPPETGLNYLEVNHIHPVTTLFDERPLRQARTVSTENFTAKLDAIFGADLLNAAVTIWTKETQIRLGFYSTLIVTLSDPKMTLQSYGEGIEYTMAQSPSQADVLSLEALYEGQGTSSDNSCSIFIDAIELLAVKRAFEAWFYLILLQHICSNSISRLFGYFLTCVLCSLKKVMVLGSVGIPSVCVYTAWNKFHIRIKLLLFIWVYSAEEIN